jgi:hypothetical protein
MPPVPGTLWRLRAFAMFAAGTLAVHELRFLLAYGPHSEHELASEGHGYLGFVTPLAVLLLLLACGEFLVRFGRRRHTSSGAPDFWRLWAACSVVLAGAYSVQEWLEGQLSPGHPGELSAVLGGGGGWGFVAAVGVGALIAVVFRGARAAEARAAAGGPFVSRAVALLDPVVHSWLAVRAARDAVASHMAGRGPPVSAV